MTRCFRDIPVDLVAPGYLQARTRAEPSGCLLWTGTVDHDRVGVLQARGRQWSARRVVYTQARGPIPAGHVVVVTCNNPCCVAHLELRPAGYTLVAARRAAPASRRPGSRDSAGQPLLRTNAWAARATAWLQQLDPATRAAVAAELIVVSHRESLPAVSRDRLADIADALIDGAKTRRRRSRESAVDGDSTRNERSKAHGGSQGDPAVGRRSTAAADR